MVEKFFEPGSRAEAEYLLEHYNYDEPLKRIQLKEQFGDSDVKWADYWHNKTSVIKKNRDEVHFAAAEHVPSSELSNLFRSIEFREDGFVIDVEGHIKTLIPDGANSQKRFEKADMGFLERKAIYELLVELLFQLNVLEPVGHYNYKVAFNKENFDVFVKLFKKYGSDDSYAHKRMISWLEDYKKTYFNKNNDVKQPGYAR